MDLRTVQAEIFNEAADRFFGEIMPGAEGHKYDEKVPHGDDYEDWNKSLGANQITINWFHEDGSLSSLTWTVSSEKVEAIKTLLGTPEASVLFSKEQVKQSMRAIYTIGPVVTDA